MQGECCLAAHANATPPWTCQCECHNRVHSTPKETWVVVCDGPSRPMIAKGMRIFRLQELIGSWTAPDDDEELSELIVRAVNATE